MELGMQRGQAVWAVTLDFFLTVSGPEGVRASWGHSTGTPSGMWVLLWHRCGACSLGGPPLGYGGPAWKTCGAGQLPTAGSGQQLMLTLEPEKLWKIVQLAVPVPSVYQF